jgi:hypothetical protein
MPGTVMVCYLTVYRLMGSVPPLSGRCVPADQRRYLDLPRDADDSKKPHMSSSDHIVGLGARQAETGGS